jgi:hypothetical protein
LGWYTSSLMDKSGVSSTELIAFSIEDVKAVDKFIISDPFGNRMEIVRNGKKWTDEKGGCVQQESVDFILEAFKNIEFKGYLPENSRENHIKMMSVQHTKVEIFQNGEWIKTWYIGVPTPDHYGQVMFLDSKEYGKSDLPVIMKIKGLNGIIEPRFFADPKKWMCTNVFALSLNQIKKVDVKFIKEPIRSFSVTKSGSKLNVYHQDKKLPFVDTSMIFSYLNNFKKIHFENANYELNPKQVDSVKKSTPFVVLTLTETNKRITKLRMFTIKAKAPQENEFGTMQDSDMEKFWCQLPNGSLVKCQYFAFNPIILGHVYFPMNIEEAKK